MSSKSYGLATFGPEVFLFLDGFSDMSSGISSFSSTFSSFKFMGGSFGISKKSNCRAEIEIKTWKIYIPFILLKDIEKLFAY